MNPIELFKSWYHQQLSLSQVRLPSACCFSTIGTDGFPNSRFVSLKEVTNDSFIITGTLSSRKRIEIDLVNKVALSFWWAESERQVRIQGVAVNLSDEQADKFFSQRNRDSQIVSVISRQGEEIGDLKTLENAYDDFEKMHKAKTIERPDNFGGYEIHPLRIEFLEFKPTRFHDRKLFEKVGQGWNKKQLQP